MNAKKSGRVHIALRIAPGITVLILLLLAYSGSTTIKVQAAAAPDFALSANYGPPFFIGNIIRGGLENCPGCTTSVEPRYLVTSFGECFFDSNTAIFPQHEYHQPCKRRHS